MNLPLEKVFRDREKVRYLDRLELMIMRHKEIFPAPVPAHDAIIKNVFGDSGKSNEEVVADLDNIFGYMFLNAPADPNPPRKGSLEDYLTDK